MSKGRDPVDVAEMQRDYEETYGSEMQQNEDRFNHELNQADMEHCDWNES